MGFLGELKRRNVFRMAVAYLLGAWLLVQICETLFPAFGVPDSVFRALVIILLLGLPVVLLLSWVYELTPEGLKAEQSPSAEEISRPHKGQKINFLIISLFAFAVIYLLVDKFVLSQDKAALVTSHLTPSDQSVAALPFVSHGSGEDIQAFASGVHDDLLTQLSKISGLRVISRTSVREYANSVKNIRQIGEELSVRHILEGGVQKAGDRIRINVQLIDAQTDSHLWAESYDRSLTTANIFAIQAEISRNIASALQLTLSPETASSLSEIPTDNLDAYGYYLAAMNIVNDSNNAFLTTATQQAIDLLQSAVTSDPGFALAWNRLAEQLEWVQRKNPDASLHEQAEAALAQAVAINPNLPDNHLVKARFHENKLEFEDALSELALAEKGMPGNAQIYRRRYWIYMELGQADHAQTAIEQAMQLDPRNEGILRNYGWNLLLLRRYQEAREHFGRAIEAFPDKWLFRMFLAEVDLYQYGDSESLKNTFLRPDARLRAPNYAAEVAEVAWVSGDYKTALSYAEQATEDPSMLDAATSIAQLKAWIFRSAGLKEESLAATERALLLARQGLQERPDDPLRLMTMAKLLVLSGDNREAVILANNAYAIAQTPEGRRRIDFYDGYRYGYAQVLCSADDLVNAEIEFRRILSEQNGTTVAYLLKSWPPCSENIAGTENYLRLEAEFGHLATLE